MKETSARLLRLLALLQVRRVWSGEEIASRLGVTTRTVRRDIEKLRDLDYPVTALKGLAGGYSIGIGAHLPPLLLDDEEAVAMAITLRTAATSGVTGIGETALRALIKLESMLPSRLRARVNAIQLSMLQTAGRGPSVDAGVLTSIGAACRDHLRLRFDYTGLGDASSLRVAEPQELITWGSRWYLVAWDVDRGDWTAFQVDRIQLRGPAGPRFTPRRSPKVDAQTHMARSIAQMWPQQAAIRMQERRRVSRT
ncbi:MAG TPA: WYL domain-containing protein [Candidatus Dormibacteraeota bacterium]|nr:WYL domain-containing protein [Candidatus Dormibacteraeota bacterium]